MIERLLVANRGEIARRVFATCRTAGIETVAVYADADADSPHAVEADFAVRLPGSAPADTYLRADLLIEAARKAGADAVHPGYGFLSENAEFARAVLDAGLTWVGPPPKAIAVMGSKLEAKALLAEAGVPMLPTWTDPGEVTDFPVLVKASAGGGGRGMRIVRDAESLADAVAAARREAAAAFGDGTVFCERYVEAARHVEVQVLADSLGNVVTLGERECSIQRRHQKIVEETPSPAVTPALRERLCAAATAAARAIGYVGAGTVEFLLADSGDFYFLEMNTRLQVEHPVTECVAGVDLVRLQLLIAEGGPLPFDGPPPMRGHAIEVRLYAEDPAAGWLPSTGTLHRIAVPGVSGSFGPLPAPGLRLDSGVCDGSLVGVHYDPMLAKVIAWAPTRTEAARMLATALAGSRIHGLVTNRDLLVRVLRHPSFRAGDTDTGFLEAHPEVFAPLLSDLGLPGLAAALARAAERSSRSSLPSGWRNVPSAPQTVTFGEMEIRYRLDRDGALVEPPGIALVSATPDRVVLSVDGVRRSYSVHRVGDVSYVDGPDGSVALTEAPRFPLPTPDATEGSLVAPLPGTVGRVLVTPGQPVAAGDLLLTLEAMKLEHPVYAPVDGVVADLRVEPGSQVERGAALLMITETLPCSDTE
ncbi:biotin/lipoyl-binding protein [Planosporangium thailandense]|uniref:Biotin/lipoyl-binding protein n=1 Tax=Planosporangium thailandense TaxID=765197 RepID=A0ABX0XT35_9ACTN|nr:biotin carboxylase N-terminal domain-containing protein [Planosporangium thailandense]NJC69166.1 biotin/lipoyl-binding protein [Planosporangium thailandense]